MSGLSLSRDELATVRAVIAALLPKTVTIHAFGSRAHGQHKPWSDLDLVLEAEEPLPLSLLAELAEAFAESSLPWKVDLVDRRSVSDAFGALIDRQKVPLD